MYENSSGPGFHDDSSSGWTTNSYGQKIFTKARRFVVVRAASRACTAVPITTYAGLGVSKRGVKKSDHCIVHTGSAPEPRATELPHPPELGMQAIPIKVDVDDRSNRLDIMSRIDLSKPIAVDYYNEVKNFGKVHPYSLPALLSQFQNVMDPSRVQRPTATATSRPIALQSSRTRYLRAYSALINDGWPHQKATAYVNLAIRGARIARQDGEESSSDSEDQGRGDSEI